MGGSRRKILMAGLSLAVSLVMLTAGTYAWLTISTVADAGTLAIVFGGKYPIEASMDYNPATGTGTWAKQIDISDYLSRMNIETSSDDPSAAPLRPITTADLTHWYSAEYAGDGSVQTFSLEQLDAIANKVRVTGQEAEVDDDGNVTMISVDKGTNCLIYFDIYVRAAVDGERWGLKLSTVKENSGGGYGDKLVTEEQDYGTYVMLKPQLITETEAETDESGETLTDEDGKARTKSTSYYQLTEEQKAKDALNSLRIGFAELMTETVTDAEGNPVLNEDGTVKTKDTVQRYLIYEPNANTHTSDLSTANSESYRLYQDENGAQVIMPVSGYDEQVAAEKDETSPLYADGRTVTWVPQYVAADDPDATAYEKTQGYRLVRQFTLQQRASVWETDESGWVEMKYGTHWSKYVESFGTFYDVVSEDGQTANEKTGLFTKTVKTVDGNGQEQTETWQWTEDYYYTLCNITYAEPVKIRVFIWIEGQDIDCWNQIMGGEILANFEFVAGDPYNFDTRVVIDSTVKTQAELAAEAAEKGSDGDIDGSSEESSEESGENGSEESQGGT